MNYRNKNTGIVLDENNFAKVRPNFTEDFEETDEEPTHVTDNDGYKCWPIDSDEEPKKKKKNSK